MKEYCPTCGHLIGPRRERLTTGLVSLLSKFARALEMEDKQYLHLQKELNLSKSEYNNFQKLRYHDLVYRKGLAGCWGLTQLGKDFIYGTVSIPQEVFVRNNQVVNQGSGLVFVYDVLRSSEWADYWDQFERAV